MCPHRPSAPALLIHPDEVARFDRGGGVATVPYVGRWNSDRATVTTGQATWVPAGVDRGGAPTT
ncbi:hypothetical protein [Streptomyces sp. WAC 01325]|uniref:hypothetical protein n=1 Tax=Streptomyces sp. WAC 01325 TaxID=2203202 RepID=UPI0021AEB69C|nr:hypothetical protein [Streptomyces sp. WAC 01325]